MIDGMEPGRQYRFGRWCLERRGLTHWGASDGALGVGEHATPWGAVIGLLRFRRDSRRHWATIGKPPHADPGPLSKGQGV